MSDMSKGTPREGRRVRESHFWRVNFGVPQKFSALRTKKKQRNPPLGENPLPRGSNLHKVPGLYSVDSNSAKMVLPKVGL